MQLIYRGKDYQLNKSELHTLNLIWNGKNDYSLEETDDLAKREILKFKEFVTASVQNEKFILTQNSSAWESSSSSLEEDREGLLVVKELVTARSKSYFE